MRVAAAALRPGLVAGSYPEREDLRDGFLDRAAASAAGLVRQHLRGRRPQLERLVRRVERHAEGLESASDEALRDAVARARETLHGEGLTDDNAARGFALVRELAGRHLGMRHYDVQLFGGWVMLNGMVAEMETGEGKTLTATLPAAVAALAGIPVHVVTVNDFLVERDAGWMAPLYRALGLTVGTIVEDMEPARRRKAYACDVTYCTNKQLVFDYLKDRILLGVESRQLHLRLESLYAERPRTSRLLLRGLCFAIVDEADSVLVDEARTPLIISKSGDLLQQERTYKEAVRIAGALRQGRDFAMAERNRRVELTELGKAHVARLTRGLAGVWSGAKRRERLVRQGLSALHQFERDKHYLVSEDGKIQLVDEYTGRVMADRAWEGGLHQMVQAKEGLTITGRQETLARISYQRFFRRYLRVGGMTGTAREVARELWTVYRLNVVSVPTNRPVRRQGVDHRVYVSAEDKWRAIVECIRARHEHGQPVLVGTRSVAASEHLSVLLERAGLAHQVLNARQNEHEAEVIAHAGERGRITVATNMAGRGTDIILGEGVRELGGLHVIATERHEARRIDRQLFGRGARQGDPGSYQAVVSLADELVTDVYGDRAARLAGRHGVAGTQAGFLGRAAVATAQRAAEAHHARVRRDLLKLDDNLDDMLAYAGRGE